MPDLAELIHQGSSRLWLFIPTAVLLGALHGLEPGHSKTMMAAFIVAVRGTVAQAVWLGLSAALSHTLLVWIVALAGLHFGSAWTSETNEPYFQLVSAILIVAVAAWMALRTWRGQREFAAHHHHGHDHHHHHGHDHTHDGHHHHHHHHEDGGMELNVTGYQDAHERAHAQDIRRRFAHKHVTTSQIIFFGITGGLIPCPAAITVLVLCLQLKKVSLGALLVVCFSVGLALTMVMSGVIAALGARHAAKRFEGFTDHLRKAPYVSSALIAAIGIYVGVQAWVKLG